MHFKEEIHGSINGKFLAEEVMNMTVDIYEYFKYLMEYIEQIPANLQIVFWLKLMKESYKLSENDRIEFEVWKDEYEKEYERKKKQSSKKKTRCSWCEKPKHPYYDEVMKYRKQGKTYREIGNIIGYSYQTVYNIANA
jgi:hypothetical protein